MNSKKSTARNTARNIKEEKVNSKKLTAGKIEERLKKSEEKEKTQGI